MSGADKILEVFNKKKFSRDIPFDEEKMSNIIKNSIKKNKPIQLIGYCGASNKNVITTFDKNAIAKFNKLNSEIKKIYSKGLNITFIMADEHSKLNQFNSKNYKKYLNEICKLIKSNKYNCIYLNKLWKKFKINDIKIKDTAKKITKKQWFDIPNRRELEKSARNLGFENYIEEAKRYYSCRKIESKHIEQKYSDCIYFTYSSDDSQHIFPNIPTIYLWVDEVGKQNLPWFEKIKLRTNTYSNKVNTNE